MNDKKAREFVAFAHRIAEEEAAWADWHNRVFGADGKFAEYFRTEEERAEFMDSAYLVQIDRISKSLREGRSIQEYTIPVTTTASGKFLVRIPASLHEALVAEARVEGVSLNQLVLSKLAVSLRSATQKLIANSSSQPVNN